MWGVQTYKRANIFVVQLPSYKYELTAVIWRSRPTPSTPAGLPAVPAEGTELPNMEIFAVTLPRGLPSPFLESAKVAMFEMLSTDQGNTKRVLANCAKLRHREI